MGYGFGITSFSDSSRGDVNGQATRIDLSSGGSVWAGQYQVMIVGVADKAGNVMAPTLLTLSIDQASPVATWLIPRASGTTLRLPANSGMPISIGLADTGGSGIDLTTVVSKNLTVTRGGQVLVFGQDYSFETSTFLDSYRGDVYSQATRIDFHANAWSAGQYQISLSGVADRAGNVMPATQFNLTLSVDHTPPVATWLNPSAIGTTAHLLTYIGPVISFELADAGGLGIDSTSVNAANVVVTLNGMPFTSYGFSSGSFCDWFHGDVNGQATRIDLTTRVWSAGQYQISISGVADKAGNVMAPTQLTLTLDQTPASVLAVSSPIDDGAYKIGTLIPITVSFSENVMVDISGGIPTLLLNSGGTAFFAGGSGCSTLTFNYTVGAAQSSGDLDYASHGALSMNGGTIGTAGVNAVALTLPEPGAPDSLGFNKNIEVLYNSAVAGRSAILQGLDLRRGRRRQRYRHGQGRPSSRPDRHFRQFHFL